MMKKYIYYFKYIIIHKFYVMIECFKEGLYYRGLVHDLSKFLPSEFITYANYFYGNIKKSRDSTGYYDPANTGDKKFEKAWFLHQKRNKHHWQYWVFPLDKNGIKIIPIEEPYLTEMICDWIGAGKAQGNFPLKEDKYSEVRKWYIKNGKKMQISKATRDEIEKRINIKK